jgi:pimeloyl-ACP methyl ester carboxylesterase
LNLRNIQTKADQQNSTSTNQISSGYDGAIIPNQYKKDQNDNNKPTSYLVKSGIWQKYQQTLDSNEGIVGLPYNQESNTNYPSNNANQLFERGYKGIKYDTNKIMSFPSGTYHTVNQVGKKYNNEQSYWNLPTGDTWGENKDNDYCKQWFNGGLLDLCVDLTRSTSVSGGQLWDNKNTRSYNFQVISNNPQVDKYSYPTGKDVTILIHGWNNDSNSWACGNTAGGDLNIAQKIYNQNQSNNIILCLDWREIANSGNSSNWWNSSSWINAGQPDREASWVKYVAESTKTQLNKWGMSDTQAKTKVSIMGHSLGAILGGQIGKEFGGVKELTAMDPAGRAGDTFYNIGNNTTFTSFQGSATDTRAFAVESTLADHRTLATTANQKFSIEANGTTSFLDKHAEGLKAVRDLYFNNTSFTESLQAFDPTIKVNNKDFNAHIVKKNSTLQYMARNTTSPNLIQLDGTNQGDEYLGAYRYNIENNSSINSDMYGGNGNDTFWGQDLDSSAYSFVKDFGGQSNESDKISLQKEVKTSGGTLLAGSQYWIDDFGGKKDIRRHTCNSQTACQGTPSWGSDHTNVAVEGGRVSSVTLAKIQDAQNAPNGQNDVFIIR